MYSFLKRHEVDKSAEGFNSGEDGFPSPGRVAWSAWGGDPALSWSSKIREQVEKTARSLDAHPIERTADALDAIPEKETTPMTEPREAIAPAVDEVVDPAMPYGIDSDMLSDSIMAADAAMDAAQNLLESYETIDPIVAQAYYLIKAADAALGNAIDCLGLVDADDEMSEGEPATDMAEMMSSSDVVLEQRKSAIATAERITMTAEVRSVATDDGSLKIAGYAATFNSEATGLSTREVIAPGAFTRALQSNEPVFLLVNHDTDALPLASTQSGTLRLSEDSHGLRMEADLDPMNPRAQEVASVLSRGDADKMSFAFTVAPGGETRSESLRTLTDLNLYEVSLVTWPAYDSTSAGMRSAEADSSIDLETRKRLISLRMKLDGLI
jgi:HK97 family phage prohead protease